MEGISILEARHIYVEALLRVAAESYKKNIGRDEAQQIIHAFAIMKPSGGDESSDDLLDTDDTSTNQDGNDDGDDTSEASEDAEEKAYLHDIQESNNKITPFNTVADTAIKNHSNTTTPYGSPDRTSIQSRKTPILTRSRLEQHQQQQHHQQLRPSSVASIQTMVTAPATPRQLPTYTNRPPSVANSISSGVRPRSAVSSRLGQYNNTRGNEKKPVHMTRDDLRVLPNKSSFNEPEFIDVNVNPWQQIPTNRPNFQEQQQQQHDSGASSSGEDSENERRKINSRSRTPIANERFVRKTPSSSQLRLPSPMYQQKQQNRKNHLSSPSPPLYLTQQQQQQQQQIHGMTPIHGHQFQSPVPGSSASSSVTATPQNNMLSNMIEGRSSNNNRHFTFANSESQLQQHQQLQQQITTLALGPATKRALESLQNEVIALNDRIDDLRRELVERDKQQRLKLNNNQSSDDDNDNELSYDMGDGWRWVIKVCYKFNYHRTLFFNISFMSNVGCYKICRCKPNDSFHHLFHIIQNK